jgi:hypothetical protein
VILKSFQNSLRLNSQLSGWGNNQDLGSPDALLRLAELASDSLQKRKSKSECFSTSGVVSGQNVLSLKNVLKSVDLNWEQIAEVIRGQGLQGSRGNGEILELSFKFDFVLRKGLDFNCLDHY